MDNLKYILVRTDGTYSIVEISDNDFLSQAYKLISCELIETVPLIYGEIMILDQEGKLKQHRMNYWATHVYQTLHKSDDYIAGNILIGKVSGCDIIGLSSDSINRYISRLEAHGYVNTCC